MDLRLSYLKQLESESIFLFREISEQFEKPALLFSGGKDSILMVHLAKKAFWPDKIPFSLVHVDTGHNFQETIDFRDELVKKLELNLIVGHVEESIKRGSAREKKTKYFSRNQLQSQTLIEVHEEHGFDVLIGGARRDEEKSRAKERFFSHRNEFSEWDAKNQRPEMWSLFNGEKLEGEHFRTFPLSNWTELDVWEYIRQNEIELPSLYFSHKRNLVEVNNVLYANEDIWKLDAEDLLSTQDVRFRTIGDITCTGAVPSKASTIDEVIEEIRNSKTSERGTRADDKVSETAMEDRKKQGYF